MDEASHEASHIVAALLDDVMGTLGLDFAYVRVRESLGGSSHEMLRLGDQRNANEHLPAARMAFERWLPRDDTSASVTIPDPFGNGNATIAPIRLGLRDDLGVVVAGSRRAGFPCQGELAALSVAATRAALGLQEARRSSEERQAARRLGHDVTRGAWEGAELLAVKDALANELLAMTRLHQFSTRLMTIADLEPLLEEALAATISLQNADKGCVHIYDPAADTLDMVAQRGFSAEWVESVGRLNHHASACGRALRRRERVIIADVQQDPEYAPFWQCAADAGFRAVQATPLFSRDGDPVGMLCTHFVEPHVPSEHELRLTDLYARQVSVKIERRLVEAALRRSEAYLSEAQRLSHTGSWAWNPATGDCFWSNELFRILGFEPHRVAPSHQLFLQRVHPEDRRALEETVARALREDRGFSIDHRVIRPNGSVRHLQNLGHPVPNKAMDRVEVIGTVMDVTERKQSQDALRRAQDALMHATRVTMLGELTASISHELNQPLAAIAANAAAGDRHLSAGPPDVREARAVLADIGRDAHRASSIISQTQALFRKRDTRRSPLQISGVVADVAALMHIQAVANGVSLQADLDQDLPDVAGDRVQLQQVIMNLVINGIQSIAAARHGPRLLTVRAGAYDPAAVIVSVRDTGIGLQPEARDRAFNAFYTTKEDGMGMGLVISRRIIEAHGGHLWATPNGDEPGETFQFTLPAAGRELAIED